MDNVTPETRSRTMRAIKSRNTAPERALRRELRAHGFPGYRVSPKGVTGAPDIAYIGLQLAVFVDGCYWHGCPEHCRRPSSNADYWHNKIARNVDRDVRNGAELAAEGWTVVRIWEHELSSNIVEVALRLGELIQIRRATLVDLCSREALSVSK